MVQTRSTGSENLLAGGDPLAAIAARLDAIDELREKVSALEANSSRRDKGKSANRHFADSEDDSDAPRSHPKPPYAKIEFPKFDGGDPRGWILKAEKFFRYYETPEDDKVDVAAMYLEGDALDLFSWMNSQRTLLYWDELVKALQEHFGPPEYLNPDEYLCEIAQTGTVHEYRQEWARRMARVSNWPEHCLLGVFMNGLQEEIRSKVRIQKPRTVYRAASLVLEFEKQLILKQRPKPSSSSFSHRAQSSYAPDFPTRDSLYPRDQKRVSEGRTLPSSSAISSRASNTSARVPVSATEAEKQRRREKGLCFRCGAPFRPGHRCSSSFSLLEIDEDGNPVVEQLEPVAEDALEEEEIAFNAILGTPTAVTMKLEGIIGKHKVLMLVDSGSTHNFIADSLVNTLNLPTVAVPTFGVRIGDGSIVRCQRVCKDIKVQLPGIQLVQRS